MTPPAEDWPQRHRLSVDEYYRMAEVGLLGPDARVELIEGEIFDMAPIGSPHAGTTHQLAAVFNRAVGDHAVVAVQSPLRLSSRSEPEPDLMLLKPRADFYTSNHPTAADTLLVVEVSDSSLHYDQRIKLPLYARHGVPEVWIVDLQNRQLHVFRTPHDLGYAESFSTAQPGTVSPAALPDVRVALGSLIALRA